MIFKTSEWDLATPLHDWDDVIFDAELVMVLIVPLVVFLFLTRKVKIKRILSRLNAAEWSEIVLCLYENLWRLPLDVEDEVVIPNKSTIDFGSTHGNHIWELLRIKEGCKNRLSDLQSIRHLYLSDHFEAIDYQIIQQELVRAKFD